MRILVVEDEHTLCQAIGKGLEKKGYFVDLAFDGQEAIDQFFDHSYDLVILDLNLPFKDGLAVLEVIRAEDKEVKVLILSARSEVEDRVLGLDSGANDYLPKPFYFAELDARIRALLRRQFIAGAAIIQLGDVEVDTGIQQVRKQSKRVILTKKEYVLLEYLALHQGKVVDVYDLMEHLWEDDSEEYLNSIKVHIKNLRKKIGEGIIFNQRGVGYYVNVETNKNT